MTALAGFWDKSGDRSAARCRPMLEAQAIYGPDQPVQRTLGSVTLGRRLYSITLADEFDRAPLLTEGGDQLFVADIRIDNRSDLIRTLGETEARFAGSADPVLALAVVERWGLEGIGRIVGPFALALWNERNQRLVLARDALGERPLHYHVGAGFVAFASMPKGLHALPEIAYAADESMAADFLALMPETGANSFFADVARVPPGHIVTIDRGGVTATRFWNPVRGTLRLKSDADYAEALREQIDRAVACRIVEVPGSIGTHLSAGLDSSTVTATAARLIAPDRLLAFTAVPGDHDPVPRGRIGDEGPLAAATAAFHANVEHVPVRSGETSPLSLMDRHFHLYERPILNPSNAVWWEAINDAARARGVRVMLTGQMGNFTISFDGYQRLPQLLRRGRLIELARLSRQLSRRGHRYRAIGAKALGPYLPSALWAWITDRFGETFALESYSALRSEAVTSFAVEERATERGLDLSYRPWADSHDARVWALSRIDPGVYNKGTLAGWGIDVRDPTSDRRLIEFALQVPDEQCILNGEPRSLARRAFADRLPTAVLHEHRRGYQAADWHVGLKAARGGLREELESFDRCDSARRLIDVERLARSIEDWPTGDWNADETDRTYKLALMRGVAAGHFLRRVARTN